VFSLPHRLQVVLDSAMEANPSFDNRLDSAFDRTEDVMRSLRWKICDPF